MNTTHRVLAHFLNEELELKDETTDKVFQDFFSRDELVQMLKWLFGKSVDKMLNVKNLSNADILSFLDNNIILRYHLQKWELEINN